MSNSPINILFRADSSSIIGTGDAFSTKTLGLIVILLGSDRFFLQPEKQIISKKSNVKMKKLIFFMVDFKIIWLK